MEYRMVYRSYSHTHLVGRQIVRNEEEAKVVSSDAQSADEAQDWSDTLNAAAREGFIVKDSGILPSGDSIIFWALMEKE